MATYLKIVMRKNLKWMPKKNTTTLRSADNPSESIKLDTMHASESKTEGMLRAKMGRTKVKKMKTWSVNSMRTGSLAEHEPINIRLVNMLISPKQLVAIKHLKHTTTTIIMKKKWSDQRKRTSNLFYNILIISFTYFY